MRNSLAKLFNVIVYRPRVFSNQIVVTYLKAKCNHVQNCSRTHKGLYNLCGQVLTKIKYS